MAIFTEMMAKHKAEGKTDLLTGESYCGTVAPLSAVILK